MGGLIRKFKKPLRKYQVTVQIWSDTFESGNLDKFTINVNRLIVDIDYFNLKFEE